MLFLRSLFYATFIAVQLYMDCKMKEAVKFPAIMHYSFLTMIGNYSTLVSNVICLVQSLFGYKNYSRLQEKFMQFAFVILVNVVSTYWLLFFFARDMVYKDGKVPLPFDVDLWIHLLVLVFYLGGLLFVGKKQFYKSATVFSLLFYIVYACYIQFLQRKMNIALYPITKPENIDQFVATMVFLLSMTVVSNIFYYFIFSKKAVKQD